jgi:hypothetical protein
MGKSLKMRAIGLRIALISGTPAAGLETMENPVRAGARDRMISEQPDMALAI